MSIESVRREFEERGLDIPIIELETSTATVELAARAHGVEPGMIAKTLAFRKADGEVFLLVASGDARIDNRAFRETFGKGKMLDAEHVEAITGHPVGGVCPFGLTTPLPVYLDASLKHWDEVMPAAGGIHTAIRIAVPYLAELLGDNWVAVTRLPEPAH
ncbi:YbaK/EbsC family protein [Paludibacterium paludis]|uniref:Cys-tRNA(Pro)/cys-tRNA(Cys) deacylase n=1 Tax=Paludibacterium paludis TaxID=1225769 RepID=A0A918NZV4_9NEIS|nr:YbaK/EbsC family protein [Paludibacterium paludis]GGY10001.1 cys-tRNA(pro)/cys-tRNA(cys) deacylase [Paludibacterium paludis]